MGLVWLFTVVGFLMIVIDLKTINASWHSIIGILIVFFTFVQPIAAMLGPDTTSQYYERFYLGHFVLGSLLHVFASKYIYMNLVEQKRKRPFVCSNRHFSGDKVRQGISTDMDGLGNWKLCAILYFFSCNVFRKSTSNFYLRKVF